VNLSRKVDYLIAIDCSFVKKSGKTTWGIDSFYNGSAGKSESATAAQDIAIADGIVSRTAPNCASPAILSGLTSASETTGFYACVDKDKADVSIFGK
jgi:hypothetical protein